MIQNKKFDQIIYSAIESIFRFVEEESILIALNTPIAICIFNLNTAKQLKHKSQPFLLRSIKPLNITKLIFMNISEL